MLSVPTTDQVEKYLIHHELSILHSNQYDASLESDQRSSGFKKKIVLLDFINSERAKSKVVLLMCQKYSPVTACYRYHGR